MASADERLVQLVARGVEDAERERGRLAVDGAHEQDGEHGVLGHVRALAEEQVPVAEAGAEAGDRGEREDHARPEDDREPVRERSRCVHAHDARFRSHKGERLGNAGANPGRSRRCEGRRFRAGTPLAFGLGRRRGREPRVRRPAVRLQLEPLAEGGFVATQIARRRRGGTRDRPVGSGRARARSRRRKKNTIFGATAPFVNVKANALDALEASSNAGEFYYHVQQTKFGPYVDQIARYAATGDSGWVFKVNGKSPPVGADAVSLKDGDTVLWYWAQFGAAGGPKTLVLERAGAGQKNCYRVFTEDDNGARAAARRSLAARRTQPHRRDAGLDAGRGRLRREASRPRARDAGRSGALERARVKKLALLFVLLLAGCGGEKGSATLKVTRDHGRQVLLVSRVPAGLTAMQALQRKAEVRTSYGGRFVVSINGLSSAPSRDWFYFIDGVLGDRSAAEVRLHDGDVELWDYRRWTDPGEVQKP